MSEIGVRRKTSLIFALKAGGIPAVILMLVTDFFFALAPMGMWMFLISLTVLTVLGMVAALQPNEVDIKERGIWFAPLGYSLALFFMLSLAGYIASEGAEGGMGYLSNLSPAIASMQSNIGLAPRNQ
ncbi:MAG: hypothetical protein L3J62_11320 [Gammaproteobacteria bacterium]|nr:hypothetical protein [Gammaproteobacteria bacterium]MCF6231351.1 hypothetical protein [Gammaproteobacteria bacterium]